MTDLKSLTYEELSELTAKLGEPKFRAGQIYEWIYKGAQGFDDMTNISKKTREKLAECSYISGIKIREKYVSKLDGTVKYLFELDDGNCIESVVMRYHHGLSECISSEVGCRMGCKFCASTIGGMVRPLTAGEIAAQVIAASNDMGERISNIVMMGIGEPLDNYDNVIKFLKNINHEKGLNIGYRHITISTCGIADRIKRLADEGFPVTLAVSLHAPTDNLRTSIMPINAKYPIAEVMEACKYYFEKTGRRLTFEYALIKNVNDTPECARELAKLLRGMAAHINLIPVNKVDERDYEKSTAEHVAEFQKMLESMGQNATVRRELGSDISASCGQLRKKSIENNQPNTAGKSN